MDKSAKDRVLEIIAGDCNGFLLSKHEYRHLIDLLMKEKSFPRLELLIKFYDEYVHGQDRILSSQEEEIFDLVLEMIDKNEKQLA